MLDGRMHQTTVRFGPDLWEALEQECRRLGVSAAHYLREAALARLAYTAGRHREPDYEEAFETAGVATGKRETREEALETAAEQALAATALSAQSQLALRRAREVREQSAELRRRRREMSR
jgi:hypothetical protein